MNMLDVDGDGRISYTETLAALNALAKMLNYKFTRMCKAELKYMWTLLDTNRDGRLEKAEVEAVLTKAPVMDRLNSWAAKVLKVGAA